MLTVYKKVEKSTNFLTGIENKDNGLDCDRPFIFSIGANSQNSFELLQKSLLLARVQDKEISKPLFRLDTFHADFLSFAYEERDDKKEIVTELVKKYFLPYLTAKGNDLDNIKKQARKMNFLVFSTTGHKIITDVENMLLSELKNIGLSDVDINDVFSQISLSCIGASINHYNNKINTVYYVDVNDQTATLKTDYLKQRIDQEQQDNAFGGIGNNLLFIFNGNGQNNIENYFSVDGHCLGGLSYVVSYFLENSISEKLPISSNSICNVIRDGKNNGNYSIEQLDKSLIYSGAKKYNEESLKLRRELDNACDQIVMQQSQPRVSDETVNFLLNEIQARCSSTVYYQICARLGLIKNPSEDIMRQKTDKELITGIQQLFGMIPAENNINKTKQKKEGE